ncbi:MAG TPA: DUF2511 domain-containing protein [Cyclobacteriaceae bacterium]|jgi:hypothetical protein|nr:DUF2511 domain-containing protein [Cyclobacteriaceae bacterium]
MKSTTESSLKIITFLIVLVVFTVWYCSGDEHQKDISKSDYGSSWPFSVEDGVLQCDRGAILFVANGKRYAVNGMAKSWAKSEGYDDEIDEILLKGADIQRVIDDGQKLCGK